MRRLLRHPAVIVLLALIVVAALAPQLAPHDPNVQDPAKRLLPPGASPDHPLGADHLGRDILSRIFYGARISLVVGLATVVLGGVLGGTMGLIGGYFGGFVDRIIMRLAEIQLSFPYILLALSLAAVVGPSLTNVVFILGFTSWPTYARVVRGSVLVEREKEYVEAARAMGVPTIAILFRHLLPNLISPLVVLTTLQVARMITAEATLSFLGLGVPIDIATWGGMLSEGRDYLFVAWWVATLPGLAILITVLAINLMGDALRDVLDPAS